MPYKMLYVNMPWTGQSYNPTESGENIWKSELTRIEQTPKCPIERKVGGPTIYPLHQGNWTRPVRLEHKGYPAARLWTCRPWGYDLSFSTARTILQASIDFTDIRKHVGLATNEPQEQTWLVPSHSTDRKSKHSFCEEQLEKAGSNAFCILKEDEAGLSTVQDYSDPGKGPAKGRHAEWETNVKAMRAVSAAGQHVHSMFVYHDRGWASRPQDTGSD